MPESCPYCGYEAQSIPDEVEHMQLAHRDVIAERLRDTGYHEDEIRRLVPKRLDEEEYSVTVPISTPGDLLKLGATPADVWIRREPGYHEFYCMVTLRGPRAGVEETVMRARRHA